MELILVAISLASLICNVTLVRRYTGFIKVSRTGVTQDLPLPLINEWAEVQEWGDWDVPLDEPQPAPAVISPVDRNPWANRSGIQQGNPSAPAPPIQPIIRPPLARPDGFV